MEIRLKIMLICVHYVVLHLCGGINPGRMTFNKWWSVTEVAKPGVILGVNGLANGAVAFCHLDLFGCGDSVYFCHHNYLSRPYSSGLLGNISLRLYSADFAVRCLCLAGNPPSKKNITSDCDPKSTL